MLEPHRDRAERDAKAVELLLGLGGPAIVVVDGAQRGIETIVEERMPLRRRVTGLHFDA